METKENYWISVDKNFSLNDVEGELPSDLVSDEIFDIERPLTKLTLHKSLFKQEVVTEVLYDETYHKYLLAEGYDVKISSHLADTYSYYMNKVGMEFGKESDFTYEHMILALGLEMGRFIENPSAESQES